MTTWTVGRSIIEPAEWTDRDPRGLLHVFEPPKLGNTYIIGCDPTVGLTGWSRYARTNNDLRIDNGTIEVIKVGNPDLQVAEYAAPQDALDLAAVLNTIGNWYTPSGTEDQPVCIIEWQGTGSLVIRQLLDKYSYSNVWRWAYLDASIIQRTKSYGWQASREGNRLLFVKCLHHITHRKIVIKSPWLLEEMADCTLDLIESRLMSQVRSRHDDRVRALFLAIWAAHEWTMEDKAEDIIEERVGVADYQATAMSVQDMYDNWNERVSGLLEGRDD